MAAPGPDPRRAGEPAAPADIRPVVATPRAGLSGLAIGIAAVIAGVILFVALDGRRRAASAPATTIRRAEVATSAAPPPLYLPPMVAVPPDYSSPPITIVPTVPVPSPVAAPRAPAPVAPQIVYATTPAPTITALPPRTASGPALVLDTSAGLTNDGGTANGGIAGPAAAASSTGRARAAAFANRATTVAQGTLIPAVLETAFDSTRPGFARALVQFDVRGFDGTRILIPRGSRLIGEYAADAAAGQKRAMVAWSRLIRPDGVTIALASPTTDPVGRGGIRANVDTHFLERFGGAILQSTLDIGVALAASRSNSPVLVALPGSIDTSGAGVRPTDIRPTLRVPAGRSISVFVARDLDFTEAESGR